MIIKTELFHDGSELSVAANDTTYLEAVIGGLIGCLCLCTCIFSYYVFRHSKFYRRAMDIDKTKKIQKAKAKAKAKAQKHGRSKSKSKSKSKVTKIIIANNMTQTSEEDEHYPMHKKSQSATNQRVRNNGTLLATTFKKHHKSSTFPHGQKSCPALGETPVPSEHTSMPALPYNTNQEIQRNIIIRQLTPSFGSIANDKHKDIIPSKSEGNGDEEVIVDNIGINDMDDLTVTMTESQPNRVPTVSNQDTVTVHSADSMGVNSYTDYLRHKKPSMDTVEHDNESPDIIGCGQSDETTTVVSRISSLSDITSMLDYFNVIGKNESRNILSNDGINSINKMNGISHPVTNHSHKNHSHNGISHPLQSIHAQQTVSPCVKQHDIVPPPESTGSLPSLPPITGIHKKKQLRSQTHGTTPILRICSKRIISRGNSNKSDKSNESQSSRTKLAAMRLKLEDNNSGSVSTIKTRSDNTSPVIDTRTNRLFVDDDDDEHEAGSGSNSDDSLFKHNNDNDRDRNVISKCKSGESMSNNNNGFIFGNRRILNDNTAPSDCTVNRMDRCLSPCNFTATSRSSSSSCSSDDSTLSSNMEESEDDKETFKINSDKCDAMSSDTWITYYKGDNNSRNQNSSKYYGSDD